MNSDQRSVGFSISNLLGIDRRSATHDISQQQNLSDKKTGKSECTLHNFDQ